MPITANVGLMGSGKTFDAVREKIVTGVSQGRRVVTNIEGINPDAIYDYVERKLRIPASAMGEVVGVEIDRPSKPGFFPCRVHPANHPTDANRVDDTDTVVKGGDLVVIDEARRFWQSGTKIPEEHQVFFAEHRHYTGRNNISCDLVYIIQDMALVHRTLKNLTELTFRFKKLKTLGLTKAYVVNQWEGYNLKKDLVVATFNRRYDPEIFPLYKSYSGAEPGKEMTVDKRQNVLRNPKLWLAVVGCIVMCLVCFRFLYKTFFPTPAQASADVSRPVQVGNPNAMPGAPTSGRPAPGAPDAAGAAAAKLPKASETWRISGTLQGRSGRYVVLVSKDGKLRTVQPDDTWTYVNGRYTRGIVDNEIVGTWSGSLPTDAAKAPPRNLTP